MAIDRSYVEENRAQLGRLRGLVERLGEPELSRPMPAGWTVAAVLAHLAFWDQRVVLLLERWGSDGRGPAPGTYDEAAVDWINDAAKPLCLGLAPRAAARLAVQAGEAADRLVAGLSESQVAANEAAGRPINVRRAEHRREHLDEIERVLARGH